MLFEAGLAIALRLGLPAEQSDGKALRHQWRILEERTYRLQQSLSDLNGFEPFIHRGTPRGMIEALLNAFADLPGDERQLRLLQGFLVTFRRSYLEADLFGPRPFSKLVHAAIEARKQMRARARVASTPLVPAVAD